MSHNPTLVLVPGAWHSASTWDKITSHLETQHFKSIQVTLPSTLLDPSATFLDDINAVRNCITAETTQGRDVVVVVHSYGGHVGNSAIKGLTRRSHDTASPVIEEPSQGYVLGIVMLSSGFTITGVSFLEGAGGKPPPSWRTDERSGYAVLQVDPRRLFYHDLSVQEGEYWVKRLTKQSLKSLSEGGEYAYAGWMDVPVWFLVTSADQALPVEAQRMFVQMARDAGGDVTMREIETSHSPMLSRPQEVADFILEAVAYFAAYIV